MVQRWRYRSKEILEVAEQRSAHIGVKRFQVSHEGEELYFSATRFFV